MERQVISVIIPVYNAERFLGRCLDSVIAQTYQNLEILLVDDGSFDESYGICSEYAEKDSRIAVLRQENAGASAARNLGLKVCQGDYIGFVDSDDWIEKDMLSYLYLLAEEQGADAAYCAYVCTDGSKRIKRKREREALKIYAGNEITEFFYRVDGHGSFYSVCNCLFRKNVILDTVFWEGKKTEDVYFTYLTYRKAKKIVVSNIVKYNYFINYNGVTRSKLTPKDFDLFDIWDKIVLEEKDSQFQKWAILNRKRAAFTLYCKGLLYGTEGIGRKELEEMKSEIKNNIRNLFHGRFLDKKRKLLLLYIVLFPTRTIR